MDDKIPGEWRIPLNVAFAALPNNIAAVTSNMLKQPGQELGVFLSELLEGVLSPKLSEVLATEFEHQLLTF